MKQLREKYGLPMAISMVIGCVIGSGVFFKAETIARIGSPATGVGAWIIGGAVMLACLLTFAVLSAEYPGENGLTGYARQTVGDTYAYYVGWFMATVYYPALVSVLAWLSARYTLLFTGTGDAGGGLCMLLSCLYLAASFAQNTFLPELSDKIQITATVIKIIPLVLMTVFGIINGFESGIYYENFAIPQAGADPSKALFSAIVATAFAYEGWIAATSIGAELKNSRKNLPLALIIGGGAVGIIYVMYYIGISGAVNTQILINYPQDGIKMAFDAVLGNGMGGVLAAFVAVSCLGALNGMMLGLGRAMYCVASGGRGPAPKMFSHTDPMCNMPVASCTMGFVLSMGWLFFLYGAQISEAPLFGEYSFDSSELPIVTVYTMYIPMFFMFIKKRGRKNLLRNLLIPLAGICASAFMVFCAVSAHIADVVDYLFFFTAAMLAGAVFVRKKKL